MVCSIWEWCRSYEMRLGEPKFQSLEYQLKTHMWSNFAANMEDSVAILTRINFKSA